MCTIITQEHVAQKLRTNKLAVSRMENHAEDIRPSTLRKYAEALGKEIRLEIALLNTPKIGHDLTIHM